MGILRFIVPVVVVFSLHASAATLPPDHLLYPADTEVEFLAGLSGSVSVNFAKKLLVKCADGTAEIKYADLCRIGGWLQQDRRSPAQFPWDELKAQVLYFGEMHMGQEAKTFLTDHMIELKKQGVGALALEMFNSKNQPILDLYVAGLATIEEVKTALVKEWNYDSEGYLSAIEAAKAHGMRILAIDDRSEGWNGGFLPALIRRDAHMAKVIAGVIQAQPDLKIAVLVGRMHAYGIFSDENLVLSQPAVLREQYGITTQSLMVFSNREVGNVGPNSMQKAIMGEGVPSILAAPAGYGYTDYFLFLRDPVPPSYPAYINEPSWQEKLRHLN